MRWSFRLELSRATIDVGFDPLDWLVGIAIGPRWRDIVIHPLPTIAISIERWDGE